MSLSDLGKLREMMSQAQELHTQMEARLAGATVEATSGGGVVTVRMNGKKEILKLRIDPSVMNSGAGDIELLEDLITAAVNECGRRAEDLMKSSLQSMVGHLNLPGLT